MGNIISYVTSVEDTNKLICDSKTINKCGHLSRLMNTLHDLTIDQIIITEVLDDYLHLLQYHDDQNQFKYIYTQFPECNIAKCSQFRRHHDRTRFKQKCVALEILDRVHCYFMHSYDTCYRIRMNEQNLNQKQDDSKTNNTLINVDFLNMKRMLADKMRNLKEFDFIANQRTNKMCDQILSIQKKMFHFGYAFKYGYKGEQNTDKISQISSNYKSLKQEMLNNKISVVNLSQFNNEYQKAMKHFNTHYCKQLAAAGISNNLPLCVEYILAMMLYCNYDNLQYCFSKTYRAETIQDSIEQHAEFYHLGKCLKIIVHRFGTSINPFVKYNFQKNVKRFYCGLSETLQFPQYMDNKNGIVLHCPLSTTSEMSIATRFANDNASEGIIIELSGHDAVKYFSAAWLSDYPAEKEFFFIQTRIHMRFNNIIEVKTGMEYINILKALKNINTATTVAPLGSAKMRVPVKSDLWEEYNSIDHKMIQELMVSIIYFRLSVFDASYKSKMLFNFNDYAKEMINIYFKKHEDLIFDYQYLKDCKWCDFFEEICYTEFEWIKLDKILKLYPQEEYICVRKVHLTETALEAVLCDLSEENVKSKVVQVVITETTMDDKLSLFIYTYTRQFESIGYEMMVGTKGVIFKRNNRNVVDVAMT
eukprot:357227_1